MGYYGAITTNTIFDETAPAANDFLGKTCLQWELAADEIADLSIRTVKLRTGIVLSKNGGALPKMMQPFKFGLGAALGSGKQIMPWIHIDDLAKLFVFIIENNLEGTHNAVAPTPLPQKDLAKIIAKQKNTIAVPTPKFALNLVLGEMKSLVLSSQKCSANKILSKGFQFEFDKIDKALGNLL